MVFMVIFYLLINGSLKREIVFVRKLAIYTYSNFASLFFKALESNSDDAFLRVISLGKH